MTPERTHPVEPVEEGARSSTAEAHLTSQLLPLMRERGLEDEARRLEAALGEDQATAAASMLTETSRVRCAEVRHAVASSALTPHHVLRELASDEEEWVRAGVAANQDAPAALLREIACDPSGEVRAWLLTNEAACAEAVRAIAEDTEVVIPAVEVLLAAHPSTPLGLLHPLTASECASVNVRRVAEARGLSASEVEVAVGIAAEFAGSLSQLCESAIALSHT